MDEPNKKWQLIKILAVVSIIALICGGIYVNNKNKLDITQYNKDGIIAADVNNGNFNDIILGDKDTASVIIVEYGDYQCPACGEYKHMFTNAVNDYPDQVALVFRQYILPGHTDARAASAVALAADRQGKFWEMHSKLYDLADSWSNKGVQRQEVFEGFASELGLDIDQFKKDLQSDEIKQKIKFDMQLGKAHKIDATPYVIINGEKVDGEIWTNRAKFNKFIESKL